MLITNASRLGDFFSCFFLLAEDCAEICLLLLYNNYSVALNYFL